MNIVNFLLPMYLVKEIKELKGRTRLQKLVFLIEDKLNTELGIAKTYKFYPETYGPYSTELSEAVQFMQSHGWLVESEEKDKDRTLYSYKISKDGLAFLEQNENCFTSEIKKVITSIISDYNKMKIVQLVERVHKEYPQYCKKTT